MISRPRSGDNRLQLVSCLDRLMPEALCEHIGHASFSNHCELSFASEGVFQVRVSPLRPPASEVEMARTFTSSDSLVSALSGYPSGVPMRTTLSADRTVAGPGTFSASLKRSAVSLPASTSVGAGESSSTMRYEEFRKRFGFCIAYWCITHPDKVLVRACALRWGLIARSRAAPGHVFRRYLIRMFLSRDSSHGFEKDRYYACEEVARDLYLPVDLHVLKLEHLRVILDWARRIHKIDGPGGRRAPIFPAGQITKTVALDAIDEFCRTHKGQVIGPPLPRSRGQ